MDETGFNPKEAPHRKVTSDRQELEIFIRRTEPGIGAAALSNRDMTLFRLFELEPRDVLEEALQFALETSTSKEGIAALYLQRAYSFTRMQQYDEALKEYDRAWAIADTDASAHVYRAGIFLKRDQPEPALRDFNRALAIDPGSVAARLARGVCYENQQLWDEAIEDFTQLTAIAPDDPRGFQLRGNAYMGIGRTELALEDFNRVLELDSQNGAAYAGRAYAYTLLCDFRRAMSDYEQAIRYGVPQAEKMLEEAERQFTMQSIQQLASLSEPAGLNALARSFPFVTSPEYVMMLKSYVDHLPQEEKTSMAEHIRWLERYIADQ